LGRSTERSRLFRSNRRRVFSLSDINSKSGFQVFLHEAQSSDRIPDRQTGLKLENKLTPLAAEHLVIFTDKQKPRAF